MSVSELFKFELLSRNKIKTISSQYCLIIRKISSEVYNKKLKENKKIKTNMMEENKALGEQPDDQQPVSVILENPNKPALPFDINKLCNFGFDVLKEAIEYLAKQQAETNNRLEKLEAKGMEYIPINNE